MQKKKDKSTDIFYITLVRLFSSLPLEYDLIPARKAQLTYKCSLASRNGAADILPTRCRRRRATTA